MSSFSPSLTLFLSLFRSKSSCTLFQGFLFVFDFLQLEYDILSVVYLLYIILGVLWASWICCLVVIINFGKFFTIITSSISSVLLFFFILVFHLLMLLFFFLIVPLFSEGSSSFSLFVLFAFQIRDSYFPIFKTIDFFVSFFDSIDYIIGSIFVNLFYFKHLFFLFLGTLWNFSHLFFHVVYFFH